MRFNAVIVIVPGPQVPQGCLPSSKRYLIKKLELRALFLVPLLSSTAQLNFSRDLKIFQKNKTSLEPSSDNDVQGRPKPATIITTRFFRGEELHVYTKNSFAHSLEHGGVI